MISPLATRSASTLEMRTILVFIFEYLDTVHGHEDNGATHPPEARRDITQSC
jgi:hypothetical protein